MHDKIPWYEFCVDSVWKYFTKDEDSEFFFLNGTVYDFSADQNPIEKKDIYLIFTTLSWKK